ncbi:hypothetical protein D1007_09870 [Hordeum vulgare]|nr:hypothetical protein D1007_09870 [Hordeum vulgare]
MWGKEMGGFYLDRRLQLSEENIPCTIRDSLKHVGGRSFNFTAHGHRGHKTIVKGGNDWVKFVADFNIGAGALVVFDTSKRTAKAYVAHLDFTHLANDGDPEEDIVADKDEVGEGAGVEVFNIESYENDDHEEADARELVYTHGCVLSDAEGSLLDVVLTNNDWYIGSSFIHHFTTTNIRKTTMKIPRKVVEQLNLPPVGVAGICLRAGESMNVAYHTDCDGRTVFTNQWGVFATQTNLQEGDPLFSTSNPAMAAT